MDLETFANHITNLGKQDFDILCRIVLSDVLGLQVFNVDGKDDGGTDFVAINNGGRRNKVAYQITTQKSDIGNKAYKDAKKSIDKLGINQYFFLPTYNLSETHARKLEVEISGELGVASTVYTPKIMAGFIIENNLVRKFYELTGVEDGYKQTRASVDYLEMALHTYTILSNDTKNLKSQVYDDTLLYLLSETETGETRESLIDETVELINLPESKKTVLNGRIDALMQKSCIKKTELGLLVLTDKCAEDIALRKRLYNSEQSTFYTAQTDLLKEYNIEWNQQDSKESSVWIAEDIIYQQISGLKSAGAVISNPFFRNVRKNGLDKLRKHLLSKKKIDKTKIEEVVKRMVAMASKHPLVVKIVRASVYISLEGSKPLAAAKSLGVDDWGDVNMLVEPTIGIPHICSLQYKGSVNAYFDNAISAINRAKKLGVNLLIPYNYIKECAGHLLLARKYDGLDLDPEEMKLSRNAFVANYYAQKLNGISMPDCFLDYLATFSPSIKTEHGDTKEWIRDITTDIQSILLQSGIEYLEVPFYEENEIEEIHRAYVDYLSPSYPKPPHLVMNDVVVLKCVNDRVIKNNDHWILLTYDNSLIRVSGERFNHVWINNPYTFLDMTELTSDMPDKQFCSLIHSFAQYSEHTLSIGARIIDRIVYYASENLQQWQFKQDIETLKKDLIKTSLNKDMNYVDTKTDEFLKKHGVNIDGDTEEEADIQNDSIV